jgi:hypothetical protein
VNSVQGILLVSLFIAQIDFARMAETSDEFAFWWRNSPNVKKLAAGNPDRAIIEAEIKILVSHYSRPTFEPPRVAEPMQVETPALARLFPEHRFYLIGWKIVRANTPEGRRAAVPLLGLHYGLVVSPNGEPIRMHNDYGDFGSLMKNAKVKLKSVDDAKLIWTAFHDANQKQMFEQASPRQVSPTEWDLGERQSDSRKYWCRITLDAKQTVVSAKLMWEDVKKTEPQK